MIDENERFKYLLDALKDVYKEQQDLSLKITGFLVAVVGWFAASADPLHILCTLPPLRYLALVATAAGAAGVGYLSARAVSLSTAASAGLAKIDPDAALAAPYRVTWRHAGGALATHVLLLAGVFMLLWLRYISLYASTCHAP